jgi:hypothetical protein
MTRFQINLNVIAVGCLGSGKAKVEARPLCLPLSSVADLEPHPNANRSKLSRFQFLREDSDPAFNVYETNLIYYGEQYEKIINN